MTDCIFCRIVAGEIPARIVREDERTLAFLDIAPAAPGHLLVIPRAHSSDLGQAEPEDAAACAVAAGDLARRLSTLGADGVTVMSAIRSAAGQTVFHTHLHVIPRRRGDRVLAPWAPGSLDDGEADELVRRLRGA